jgi:hypothetical protein
MLWEIDDSRTVIRKRREIDVLPLKWRDFPRRRLTVSRHKSVRLGKVPSELSSRCEVLSARHGDRPPQTDGSRARPSQMRKISRRPLLAILQTVPMSPLLEENKLFFSLSSLLIR